MWIPNPSGPAYTNSTCRFIEDHQNCLMNGRPDKEYLHWGWKPYQCDLPLFDSYQFLDVMRDKTWAFIGDSILRNQVQSFLCLLSKVHQYFLCLLYMVHKLSIIGGKSFMCTLKKMINFLFTNIMHRNYVSISYLWFYLTNKTQINFLSTKY